MNYSHIYTHCFASSIVSSNESEWMIKFDDLFIMVLMSEATDALNTQLIYG